MFSAVGWICVQEAEYVDEFGDRATSPRQPTLDAISGVLESLVPPTRYVWPRRSRRARIVEAFRNATWERDPQNPLPGPHVLFRADNGMWTVIIDTHRNHRHGWPEQIFREVARLAPGSFGFMHIWDDEHPTESKKFMRWSMVLGEVVVAEEASLRPVMRLMWDSYDGE